MTPENMGRAFSYLLARRICSTHPEGRRRHDGEAQTAEILTSEVSGYADFEAFLNVQGFTLRVYEQAAIGAAPRGQVFVLARRCTEEQAGYIDTTWLFERMRDQRRKETLEQVVVWAAQLWAVTQWFFYTRNDRGIDAVGRFKDAFVSASQLAREVEEQIESMRTRGAPPDPRGQVVWETLTASSSTSIESRAQRFLAAMEEASLVERLDAGDEPQYCQTLNAAVEMALNLERQAFFLVSGSGRGLMEAEIVVTGIVEGSSEPPEWQPELSIDGGNGAPAARKGQPDVRH
jgi:hypothetical protein